MTFKSSDIFLLVKAGCCTLSIFFRTSLRCRRISGLWKATWFVQSCRLTQLGFGNVETLENRINEFFRIFQFQKYCSQILKFFSKKIRWGWQTVGAIKHSFYQVSFIAEFAERSPITIKKGSNPSSWKNLVVRPYDRTRCYFWHAWSTVPRARQRHGFVQ